MKKIFALILALLMVLSMVACGAKTETPANAPAEKQEAGEQKTEGGESAESAKPAELPTITLWSSGSQNVADTFNELMAMYNAKPDRKANVELQFVLSGSGDTGMSTRYGAAWKAGKYDNFDMMADNGSSFPGIFNECGDDLNAFLDIDHSKLPNWENVKMSPSVYKEKLVPYRGTTVVFAYDSAKLPNPPQTWDELTKWIKANPGKFTYNDPDTGGAGGAFLTCSLYRLIGDPECFTNPTDPKWVEQVDAGFEWLAEIHPYTYSSGGSIVYPVKNQGSLDLLASGEVYLIPAWADNVLKGLSEKTLPDTVKMYQMTDLSLSGTDVDIAICANTPYADECYDFINFVISAEGQKKLVEFMKAVPVIDASTMEQTPDVVAVTELNPAAFNILSTGNNDKEYKNRWLNEIAPLTAEVAPAY